MSNTPLNDMMKQVAKISPDAKAGVTQGAGSLRPKKARRTKTGQTRNTMTQAQYTQLDEQIFEALQADYPQCVRNVFYQMTNPRLPVPVPKTEKGSKLIGRRLVNLRRSKIVPYGWVSDATRRGYHVNTYTGEADFLRHVKSLYRADIWRDASAKCEVWCESRSIAGVIQGTCQELAVSLYPAGGFTSLTLAYQSAMSINADFEYDPRPVVIFYIGDYDPAGVLIDRKIEEELRGHLNPAVELHFVRLGITLEQVRDFNLPTKPRKPGDKRSPEIAFTVEAEAMPAGTLRALLRENIERMLPPNALAIAKVEEAETCNLIDMLADASDRRQGAE